MKVGRVCNRSVGVGGTVADVVSLISERNWGCFGLRVAAVEQRLRWRSSLQFNLSEVSNVWDFSPQNHNITEPQTRCLVSPQKNTKKTSKRPPMHTPLGAVMQQIVIIVAVTQRVV